MRRKRKPFDIFNKKKGYEYVIADPDRLDERIADEWEVVRWGDGETLNPKGVMTGKKGTPIMNSASGIWMRRPEEIRREEQEDLEKRISIKAINARNQAMLVGAQSDNSEYISDLKAKVEKE